MQTLSELDWNFDDVPDNELVACCYWEYARESAFIRDVKRRCIDPKWKQMFNRELSEYWGNDIERIQSIGYPAYVFLRGFFFDGSESQKSGSPDSRSITGSFPAPWQSLSEVERNCRSYIDSDRTAIPLVPFARGYGFFAEWIAQYYKSQQGEAGKVNASEIIPSLFSSGSETGVFHIEWGDFTNEELRDGFYRWATENRPKSCPMPDARGHKPKDLRANLARLTVMRLLSQSPALEIVDDRQKRFQAVWQTRQFSGRKWLDVTKWHDARREAGQLFHKLFPFLAKDEMPLCWKRQPPGK